MNQLELDLEPNKTEDALSKLASFPIKIVYCYNKLIFSEVGKICLAIFRNSDGSFFWATAVTLLGPQGDKYWVSSTELNLEPWAFLSLDNNQLIDPEILALIKKKQELTFLLTSTISFDNIGS